MVHQLLGEVLFQPEYGSSSSPPPSSSSSSSWIDNQGIKTRNKVFIVRTHLKLKYHLGQLLSLGVSICLDDLDKYLDEDKSRPKNLDFKNLDREKKKVDLDVMDILDGFQKLVSTRRTFSISISIGLDVETTRLRNYKTKN
jgi:hypothetical protein